LETIIEKRLALGQGKAIIVNVAMRYTVTRESIPSFIMNGSQQIIARGRQKIED